MDRNPFFPNLDTDRPALPAILITGTLISGLALAIYILLFV